VSDSTITRRSALVTTLFAALIANASQALAQTGGSGMDAALEQHRHDFDWLVGRWNVQHHRLKSRLTGSTEWEDFRGTSELWLTLNGFGTIDDNWIDIPSGAYRAMGIRAFNPETRQWSIWWLDERSQTIDPPVRGHFESGAGEFTGDDVLRGQPIKVRFRWTDIYSPHPHWEQAFSADGGATWEVNWQMEFTRA
jgi:hypothetical protein